MKLSASGVVRNNRLSKRRVVYPSIRGNETTTTPVACPHCMVPAGYQLKMSSIALVNYFRCDRCGHVWTLPKPGQDGQRHDVTIVRTTDIAQN